MGTMRSSEESQGKREAILAAARALFAQKGYEETTIADIAREAGIAVGTVYLYFRNKRDVYTGVALDIEAKIAATFRNPEILSLPFEQVPRALVEALFETSRQRMDLLSLLQIDMQSSEEVLQHKAAHQGVIEALVQVFDDAIARGDLAPFNTEMYAQMFSLLGGNIMHQCFAIEHGEREELFRTYLTEFVERVFFGPSLREGYPKTDSR